MYGSLGGVDLGALGSAGAKGHTLGAGAMGDAKAWASASARARSWELGRMRPEPGPEPGPNQAREGSCSLRLSLSRTVSCFQPFRCPPTTRAESTHLSQVSLRLRLRLLLRFLFKRFPAMICLRLLRVLLFGALRLPRLRMLVPRGQRVPVRVQTSKVRMRLQPQAIVRDIPGNKVAP